MSLYSFFPMKKRKTQNVETRRSTSTLGKLKKSFDSPTAAGNGIEILWDNNSPSPTTTIALAGKRRRRQNDTRENNNSITDVSFIVEKLSESTSPVVQEGRSVLLEMWHQNKDQKNVSEAEFTSPPFRPNHQKKTISPLSTPFIQRRTKRHCRKATKQFMLEIRKLVDEIQKSDLSGSSQSQKEIQCEIAEDQAPVKVKRQKNDYESVVSSSTQSLTNRLQTCSTKRTSIPGTTNYESKTVICEPKPTVSKQKPTISEPKPIISDCLLEDSFEWTEDDMDELILTCQLSSSGKGSLTVPHAPRPECGLSPSQALFVPETQMPEMEPCLQSTQVLFPEEEPKVNSNELVTILNSNCGAEKYEHAQQVPEHIDLDKWEIDFDEDDSLLASAAQEFELSQKAIVKAKPPKQDQNDEFGLDEPLRTGDDGYDREELSVEACRNLNDGGGLVRRSPRKENQNNKCSNRAISSKESLKYNLPTTGKSSQFTKIANRSSKKLEENPHRNHPHEKLDVAKLVVGETARVGEKQSGRVPTAITNSSLFDKGNLRTKGKLDVPCFNMETSQGRAKTKLSLKRNATPCLDKSGASFETRANENHYPRNNVRSHLRVNDVLSSPLQSVPGNMGHLAKHFREVDACSKQTTGKNCSSVSSTVSKSNLTAQQASRNQINKVRGNEMDFLLCEDDVAALLDDFNLDDVLTEAKTPITAVTSTSDVPKPSSNTSASTFTTVSQRKYSKDEIERKRLEAQRRRLAKTKHKNSTQINYSRISKR